MERRGDPLVVGHAVDPRHVLRRELVPLEARLHDAKRGRVQHQDAPSKRVGSGGQGLLGLWAARVAKHFPKQPIPNLLLQGHLRAFLLCVEDVRLAWLGSIDKEFHASGIRPALCDIASFLNEMFFLLVVHYARPLDFLFCHKF